MSGVVFRFNVWIILLVQCVDACMVEVYGFSVRPNNVWVQCVGGV